MDDEDEMLVLVRGGVNKKRFVRTVSRRRL